MSITSLALGIFTLVCNPFFVYRIMYVLRFPLHEPYTFIPVALLPVTIISAILAIVFGSSALRNKKYKPKKDGKAIAGLVLGAFYIFALIVIFGLYFYVTYVKGH